MIDLVLHKQSLISLGTNVIPRGKKCKGYGKIGGGEGGAKTRGVMGDVQMADVD